MTRVNTLNDIADIYLNGNKSIIEESDTAIVGKQKADTDLEEEKGASKDFAKNTGPEAAENYETGVNEAGGSGKKEEKNHFSTGQHVKTNNENINTFTMSKKKSTFDKLYEDVLGGDEDAEMEMPFGGGMDDAMDDGMDDSDEDSGDEITLSLPRDLAEKLHEALSDMLGDDEDIEDIEDTEDFEDLDEEKHDDEEDEEVMQEAPEVQHVGDAGPGGVDMDKGGLKGKGNKVPGSGSAHKASSGHGNGSLKGGKGEPTPLGDKSGALTGKNNKVGGTVKGGNQELYG